MSDDPWNYEIPANYRAGMVVVVKVTEVCRFGVFVEPEPGLRGLILRNEIGRPLSVGERVEARVLKVDADGKKVDFSVRQR